MYVASRSYTIRRIEIPTLLTGVTNEELSHANPSSLEQHAAALSALPQHIELSAHIESEIPSAGGTGGFLQ